MIWIVMESYGGGPIFVAAYDNEQEAHAHVEAAKPSERFVRKTPLLKRFEDYEGVL